MKSPEKARLNEVINLPVMLYASTLMPKVMATQVHEIRETELVGNCVTPLGPAAAWQLRRTEG